MEEIEGKALKTQTNAYANIVKIMTLLTFNIQSSWFYKGEQLWFIRSLLFEVITMEENDVL